MHSVFINSSAKKPKKREAAGQNARLILMSVGLFLSLLSATALVRAENECRLTGILMSADNSTVIIDDKIYRKNDDVCGGRLVDIKKDRIGIEVAGSVQEIRQGARIRVPEGASPSAGRQGAAAEKFPAPTQTDTTARPAPETTGTWSAAGWKWFSFSDVTKGQGLIPLELEFSLPADYQITYHDQDYGTFWGRPKDIAVLSKGIKRRNKNLFEYDLSGPVFKITWSMTVGYSADIDKFNIETVPIDHVLLAKANMSGMKYTRMNIGGYPACLQEFLYERRPMQALYIATRTGTNVLSIVRFMPLNPSEEANKIAEHVFSAIRRIPYTPVALAGEDASATLEKIFQAMRPDSLVKTNMDVSLALGPDNAEKKAFIKNVFHITEGPDGFQEATFKRELNNTLSVGNATFFFGEPWSLPPLTGESRLKDGKISVRISGQEGEAKYEIKQSEYFPGETAPLTLLLGYDLPPCKPSGEIIKGLMHFFDFKQTTHKGGILLKGAPNRGRIQKTHAMLGYPDVMDGINLIDEMAKRWSTATIWVNPQTFLIEDFTIEGVYSSQKIRIEIDYKRKRR